MYTPDQWKVRTLRSILFSYLSYFNFLKHPYQVIGAQKVYYILDSLKLLQCLDYNTIQIVSWFNIQISSSIFA